MKKLFYLTILQTLFYLQSGSAQNAISVAEIEATLETAKNQGRIVEIRSGSIDPEAAGEELDNLPVVFRTFIGELSYDVVVMSKRLEGSGQKLTVAGKFIPDPLKPSQALYFSSSEIHFSGEGGFKGELKILDELLLSDKNDELSTEALTLLNGKSRFFELSMPGFSDKMIMGLSEETRMSFYCGMFEKFELSGYVKSLGFTELEDNDGKMINAGKPLAFIFSEKVVQDWEDMFLEVRPANNFHSLSFKELGFHFSETQNTLMDFSLRQNPPDLPACAGASGANWQGIYFYQFDLRLPDIVKLKSGGVLPKVKAGNLYIDANGLLGQVSKTKVISLEEGTTGGENRMDLSLDNVSANFVCGNKVSAVMNGQIGISACNGSNSSLKPEYFITYDDQAGFTYRFKKHGSNALTAGNELQLSSTTSLQFEISNGIFSLMQKTTAGSPSISSNVYNNSILKGSEITLSSKNCQENIKWSTGESTPTIVVRPDVSTTYTARCQDIYCIGAESNALVITVYVKLEAPLLSSERDESPFCGNLSSLIKSEGFCPGETQWSFDGGDWAVLADGSRLLNFQKSGLESTTAFRFRTRCKLNETYGDPSNEIELNLLAAPAKPEINRSSYEDVYCTGVTLYAGNCVNGIYQWLRNDIHLSYLDGQNVLSESETGNYKYEVKCVSYSSCESETSGAHYFKIDKCACKPAPPYIQPSTFDKVEYGSEIQIHSSGCNGTVTWYNSGGEFMGTGTVLTHRDLGKHYYRATCKDVNGCESDLSGWAIAEIEKCINMPAAPVVHTSVYGMVEYGTTVVVSATNCPGTITWYNAGGEFVGTGSSFSHREMGTHYYRATCTVGNDCTSGLSNWGLVNIERCINSPAPPVVQARPEGKVEYGTVVNIYADNCPGKVTWYNAAGENTGTGTVLSVKERGKNYYRASCTTGNECESVMSNWVTVEIENCINTPPVPVVQAVPDKKVEYGTTVNIHASNCPNTVIWFNSGGENVGTGIVLPVKEKGKHYYRAKCSSGEDCESDWSGWAIAEIGECIDPPQAPQLAADKTGKLPAGTTVTISSIGCNGRLEWYSYASANKISEGSTLNISQSGNSKYYAYCIGSGGCKSGKSNDVSVEIGVDQLCNKYLPPINLSGTHTLDALGNDIVVLNWDYKECVPDWIETEKSNDGVTWSILGSAFGNNRSYTVIPLFKGRTYWFRVKARSNDGTTYSDPSNNISLTISGEPNDPDAPSIYADKKQLCPGQQAILSAHGCIEGEIRWSNGSSGINITVNSGEYTATCVRSGRSSSSSSKMIIAALPAPSSPNLPDYAFVGSQISTAGRCENGTLNWVNQGNVSGGNPVVPDAMTFSLSAECRNSCGVASNYKTVKTNKVTIVGFDRSLFDYYYDTVLSAFADEIPVKKGTKLFSDIALQISRNLKDTRNPRHYIMHGNFDCSGSNYHAVDNGNEIVQTCSK